MISNRLSDYDSVGEPESAMDQVEATARDLMQAGRQAAGQATQTVVRYVREQPGMALGVAFALGGLIGWIVKRR